MNFDGFFADLGIWLFYQLLVEPQNPSPLESFSFQKPWKIDKIDIQNLKVTRSWNPEHHLERSLASFVKFPWKNVPRFFQPNSLGLAKSLKRLDRHLEPGLDNRSAS